MLKNVLGVIGGYVTMFLCVFITFTILYLILGTDGSFQPGSYDVSVIWLIISIILSIAAAVLGGFVCVLIAKNQKAGTILAVVVLVLGLAMAIPALMAPDESVERSDDVDSMQAMSMAKQPTFILLLNPLLGAAGVFYGSRLRKYN
jgi:hypothetical protein